MYTVKMLITVPDLVLEWIVLMKLVSFVIMPLQIHYARATSSHRHVVTAKTILLNVAVAQEEVVVV